MMLAVTVYNALLCTAQTDRSGVREQKRFWSRFIESLDWEKQIEKIEGRKVDPIKAFRNLGGLIRNRGVK